MEKLKYRRLFIKDVADAAGVHPVTIRRWVDEGVLPAKRDRHGWRIFNRQAVVLAKKLAGTNFSAE